MTCDASKQVHSSPALGALTSELNSLLMIEGVSNLTSELNSLLMSRTSTERGAVPGAGSATHWMTPCRGKRGERGGRGDRGGTGERGERGGRGDREEHTWMRHLQGCWNIKITWALCTLAPPGWHRAGEGGEGISEKRITQKLCPLELTGVCDMHLEHK